MEHNDDMMELRIGAGHDIHALVAGHALVLAGVDVPSAVGFSTHSDGDVLSHAVIDALAGAMADGDLGTHFPEDDPSTQDARSLNFVKQFADRVRDRGYTMMNVDAFVVLGTVRLRPFIDDMRVNLAGALGLPLERVSVKARSNDGLGESGRGEAAEAWAHVLLVKDAAAGSGTSA